MVDPLVVVISALLAFLLSVTTYVSYEYYGQLRRAQKEYEKAKSTVEDVVFSFNRELRREAERIADVSYKTELGASKADAGLDKVESVERRVVPLESKVVQINSQLDTVLTTLSALSEASTKTAQIVADSDFSSIGRKINDINSAQEALKAKIQGLESQMQTLSFTPEAKEDSPLPVMPIKRDKALAHLTETEVTVLEFLSTEGPKTAPEIKQKVQLSREHTARLMKKLYEEGYLERETGKLPFKYSVKKEMEKLLKKPEPPPQ